MISSGRDCRYLTQELQKDVSGHTFMGEPVLTKPAEHPLFGKMEPLGQPFEKVLHDNLKSLYETEHTAADAPIDGGAIAGTPELPAVGVPDVAGLVKRLRGPFFNQSGYEEFMWPLPNLHEEAATALAALQAQVKELRLDLEATLLREHQTETKQAVQIKEMRELLDAAKDYVSRPRLYEKIVSTLERTKP